MTLHALQIPVRTMKERKLTFGGHLLDREGERTRQSEDLFLHLDVHVTGGTILNRGPRVMAAPAILERLDQRSAMRRLHSVAGDALDILVLNVTKSAQRVLGNRGLLCARRRG